MELFSDNLNETLQTSKYYCSIYISYVSKYIYQVHKDFLNILKHLTIL